MTEQSDSTIKLMGRPLLFKTANDLQVAIDKAIKTIRENKQPLIVENIALELDCSARTLRKYHEQAEKRPDFIPPIKKMLDACQAYQVSALFGGGQVAGPIFALKNNYPDEYRDKTEVDQTVVADVTSNGNTIADPSMAAGFADYLKAQTSDQ